MRVCACVCVHVCVRPCITILVVSKNREPTILVGSDRLLHKTAGLLCSGYSAPTGQVRHLHYSKKRGTVDYRGSVYHPLTCILQFYSYVSPLSIQHAEISSHCFGKGESPSPPFSISNWLSNLNPLSSPFIPQRWRNRSSIHSHILAVK